MIRNQSGQVIGATMVDATTGAAFVGVVTCYVTGDGGTQALGSVGSGICTSEGNSYYTYTPSAAETNYALVAFTFIGTGAIPATVQVTTITETQSAALNVASSGVSFTARQLVTRALKRIGVVGAGQTPSSEDATDGFDVLNTMLDALATERLMVPCIVRSTWTIVSGTAAYTVGSGGTVNIDRPVFVQNINFQDTAISPVTEMPLESLTDQAYANIPQKTATAPYPYAQYYNPTFTGTGLATITLFPVPTSSTLQGVIYAPTALTQVASLDTTMVVQPGLRWFLQEQLAAYLAPEFGVQLPQEIRESARESKANFKRGNIRLVELATVEGALFSGRGYGYNILTDR